MARDIYHRLISRSLANRSTSRGSSKRLGFYLCKHYSSGFKSTITSIYDFLSCQFPDTQIALGVYGSPSRDEMAAESDADIILISLRENDQTLAFRRKVSEALLNFQFAKVDMLNWGSIDHLRKLAKESIVEGNQILETIPIAGNNKVIKQFKQMQKEELTVNRCMINLIFQKYCCDTYYARRRKSNLINIKYSHGGTRDLLFFVWLARTAAAGIGDDPIQIRTIFESLDYLNKIGLLDAITLKKLLDSASEIMLLRSESLKYNKGSLLQGLSFINLSDIKFWEFSIAIRQSFKSSAELKHCYTRGRNLIKKEKCRLINQITALFLDKNDHKLLKQLSMPNANPEIIKQGLKAENEILKIVAIWESSKRPNWNYFSKEINKLINTHSSWAILGSLVSQKQLNSRLIDNISKIVLNKPSYGYILRIIAQHPNVVNQTLKNIAEANLDKRYTELAQIAINKGQREANYQV